VLSVSAPAVRNPATGADLGGVGRDELFQELLDIAECYGTNAYYSGGYFLLPSGDGQVKNERARRVGLRLHELGGIKLMREAHAFVLAQAGRTAARDLETCWDGIGEWQM